MVHFTGAETSERHQKFDALQQEVNAALSYPGVQEELGSLGAALLTLNQEAFLPNVSDGRVSTPRRYRDSDATALLPRLSSDNFLYPADSLLQPTPDRWRKVRRALKLKGGDPDSFLQQSMDRMKQELSQEKEGEEPLLHPEIAISGAISHFDLETDILMTGRTIMAMEYDEFPDPTLRGVTGAHEWVHIHDLQKLETQPDDGFAAYTEFRAYKTGGVTLRAAISAGVIDADMAREYNQPTATVEDIIERHEIDSTALLEGRIERDDRYYTASLEMFFQGFI